MSSEHGSDDPRRDSDGSSLADDEPDAALADRAAFDVVGHEIRLATIEALAEERREAWLPNGLSFSELCDRVDVDDTGKFNYHLGKLRGTYVTEDDGEYVLTNAGFEIAGALRAGTFDPDGDLERRDALDRRCTVCGGELEAIYANGYLRVACDTHGEILTATLPPAAVRGRDAATIVDLAESRAATHVRRVHAGGCPHCWGQAAFEAPATPSETYLAYHGWDDDGDDGTDQHAASDADDEAREDDQHAASDADDDASAVAFEHEQVIAAAHCEDCGLAFWLPVSVLVAHHQAVVAYYDEHDVDLDGGYLDLPHVTGGNGVVVDRDPVRIELDVHAPDAAETLVVTVDDTGSVVDARRESTSDRQPN